MQQFRRSIILIDKKFQLRFCLYVCSWLFALSLVYPLIIDHLFEILMIVASKVPDAPAAKNVESTKTYVVVLLVILQLLFVGITFLISLFVSHRIAGPLFKLKKFFAEASQGHLSQNLKFREKDHFQDVADEYNSMMGALRRQRDSAVARIEQALEHTSADGKRKLQEALELLREKH